MRIPRYSCPWDAVIKGHSQNSLEVDHQSRSTSLTKQFELTLSDSWVPFITLLVGLGINEKFEYGRDIRTARCNRSDPPLLLRDQTLTFNLFVVVVLRHSRTSGIAAALRRFHAYWNLPHFQVHFISNHCILFSFSLFDRVSLLVPPHAQCSYFLFVRKVKLEDAGRSTGTADAVNKGFSFSFSRPAGL